MSKESVATLTRGVVERAIPGGYFDVRFDDAVRVCHIGQVLRRIGVVVRTGDRVTVLTERDGIFRGEITQVRPQMAVREARPEPRASLITRSAQVPQPQEQRLDRTLRPGWPTGVECLPRAGDEVYCTAGPATVLRVLGKTGNGSRLLELNVLARPRYPFFAAASNVMVAPQETMEATRDSDPVP